MQSNTVLNTQQKELFFREGYLKLPFTIPPQLLEKLRIFFEKEMLLNSPNNEKVVHENKGKQFVINLDNICSKGNLACLELLGHPSILEIAEQLCGEDFFLIQEFAVMKVLGDELPVLWHQDMYHQRKGTCFTMGIYIDDANEADGALRVVPTSHLSEKEICALSKEPSIEIPMKAGEILIHDMMLAHSSGIIQKNDVRRVIYFEFLSAKHVLLEEIYSIALVKRRTKLLFVATAFYQQLNPLEKQFIHKRKQEIEDEEKTLEELITEIYAKSINAIPSTYCLEF
jgi:hypothetical protein